MASIAYDFLHKYLDDASYTKPSSYSSSSPLEILQKISEDTRFDGLFDGKGDGNINSLFENHESLVLEHWNAWDIVDPNTQFRESQETAIALLVRTVEPGTHAYDFFMVHLLTSSHAVRILIPLIPKRFHVGLVRQWWLLTIAVYVAQLRPKINMDLEVGPKNGWKYVEDKAINSPWATDAHYVKGEFNRTPHQVVADMIKLYGPCEKLLSRGGMNMSDIYLLLCTLLTIFMVGPASPRDNN